MAGRGEQTGWLIRYANGGWLGIEGTSEKLLVRVALDESGRYRVRELYLGDSGEPLTPQRLRAVRLGAIESAANVPDIHEAITERLELPAPPLGDEDFFSVHPGVPMTGEELRALSPKLAASRSREEGFRIRDEYRAARAAGAADSTGEDLETGQPEGSAELAAPESRGYPDAFYAQVAEQYRAAVRRGERPVSALTRLAGVPRTTAARWVKEARRRDYLPKAQPGKVSA